MYLERLDSPCPQPVHTVLELFKREEDEDRRGLEPRPRRNPAFEHEHRSFGPERVANDAERGLEGRSPTVNIGAVRERDGLRSIQARRHS